MEKDIIGKEISGKVIKVENYGLFVEFDNNQGFLPKQNMNIGKKRKLIDIFSLGFIVKARVINFKKDFYILSQKDKINDEKNVEKKAPFKKEKVKKKKIKKEKIDNVEKAVINQEPKIEKTKITDLHKLRYLGNMKISVKKGKKAIIELAQENEEKQEFLEIPNGFLEQIIATTESKIKKFENIKQELLEKGYLDSRGQSDEF
ncbi:S1 RNA binding domain protein [Gemella bergeri ATCC 700627]|uniref:S1 RNA binding domain protein n=1 Tax=Gemella bergeri ATCC 700627 TaxID=1321820 RepID=U2QQ18_9BACL|nr:S1 RNA-binding domain-containing protein [Gemella bergeri]ERK58314.1 S1 RNA binding domain protein [Gemella bergeri ATCC 700627]